MPLREYNKKRNFKDTPEPKHAPRKAKSKDHPLMFVVQEHHASRLHYDFRLEYNGVLKSWAVPKGPSNDPTVKRLAVETEDHPLSYGNFEGVIPEGNYGAGRVYIWDTGIWEPIGNPREGLKKGHLEFKLKGKHLHGQWMLIKTSRPASGDKSQWLLVKRTDAYANTEPLVPVEDPKTGKVSKQRKTTEPVAEKKSAKSKKKARVKKLPGFISPQLAELVKEPPEGENWVHETKFDGYRTQAHIQDGKAVLYTRNGLNWSQKYPVITSELRALPVINAILDGEVVWLDDEGRSDFQKLQNSLKTKESKRLIYYVFDLLFIDGVDCRSFPLRERKHRLEKILAEFDNPIIRYSDHVDGSGADLFEAACNYQLEGLVSKDLEAPYRSNRNSGWVKTKCKLHQEFVIGGYTSGEGSRNGGFGALLLGVYEDGKLRYVGKVGTGFTERSLMDIHKKLRTREISKSPFDIKSPQGRGVHYIKPGLVAEVSFGQWTSDKILRTAVFHGLREDKPAEEIHIETKKSLKAVVVPKKKVSKKQKGANETLALTNPDKILYRKEKITKLQIARYYQDFAEVILPHIANRPLALLRCPEGSEKTCFFQKHIAGKVPLEFIPVTIVERSGPKAYLTIDSKEGLLSLSQMNAFELHAWNCHSDAIENPDQIVMDFDPGPGVHWKQVVEAAFSLKEILDGLQLKSYVKVSGGKGVHVHIPVAPVYSWDQIKTFSHTLGKEMASRDPDRYTVNMAKKVRGKRIFVDYLRNGRGATAVVPYSLRARKMSAVAMPITWEELKTIEGPAVFTLENAIKHLSKRKVDPWKDFFKKEQRINILKPVIASAV
ncbi:DNA ligase D [Bdellovibrio bacteriovorus]